MNKSYRKLCLFILALVLVLACQKPNLWGEPFHTPTPTATATQTLTPTATLTPTVTPTITPTPRPTITRVLIVSFDGLRPDAIALAPMPNLQALMQIGAYTLNAQTIYLSSTLPAHTSMLDGMCPAKHGVTWDDYQPSLGYAKGTDLFDLAHAAGLKTVMYVGKDKLRQVTEPASTDVFKYINDRDSVIVDHLLANFPLDFGLMFVHFPTVDMMGHEYGWLSPEQLSVARRGDQALGKLLAALDANGLRDETLIIVSADHGGHKTSHGSSQPEDMTIPWIMVGPGVLPMQITEPIVTMDTAATAAWALGLPIPPEWDGKPITQAFGLPVEVGQFTVCK